MKISRLLLLGTILAGMLVYISCRKIDRSTDEFSPSTQSKFFTSHSSNKPLVQAITQYVKRQNEKYNFVGSVVNQIGYPRWDNALVANSSGVQYRGASDSTELIYIPFVRENENFINAFLLIQINPSDTTHQFICDWQYAERIYGSPAVDSTAEHFALFFMMMDNYIFRHNRFILTDTSLFSSHPRINDTTLRRVDIFETTNPSGRNNVLSPTICFELIVCGTPSYCDAHNGCDYMNCISDPDVCFITTACIDFEENPPPGGGGGSPPGGGGSPPGGGGSPPGGGGGWIPPPCPGGTSRGTAYYECQPGWVPDPGGGGSTEPDPCAKVSSLKTDSLFKESVNDLKGRTTQNREFAYLHKSDGGRLGIYTGTPDDCEVNVPIYPTTPLLKSHIHSHNNTCPLPIFGPEDLKALGDLFIMNKYSFTQPKLLDSLFSFGLVTDSAFYLMVIDDPGEFENFCNDYIFPESPYDMKRLTDVYNSYDISRSNSSVKNEEEFLRFLKRLGIKVKLLKANNDLSAYSIIMLNRDNNRVPPIPCPQ